ncbi:hypothetical protein [Halobacillus ihumii]|uniref:hypothetical protein n=1 Tax=Halobacillus ihumii TaxID=2686092 RepID=UPI0013D0DC65|nr:hypothetical protein [Halobacillus ihumii]
MNRHGAHLPFTKIFTALDYIVHIYIFMFSNPDKSLSFLEICLNPISKIMNLITSEMKLFNIGKNLFFQVIEDQAISNEEFSAHLIERKTV